MMMMMVMMMARLFVLFYCYLDKYSLCGLFLCYCVLKVFLVMSDSTSYAGSSQVSYAAQPLVAAKMEVKQVLSCWCLLLCHEA